MTEQGPLLQIHKLCLRFRGLVAVNEVDLTVQRGEIFAVIGPNGAGKTSLFNAITGIYEPTSGEVRLEGRDLRKMPSRQNVLAWLSIGLAVGLSLFLIACDVNQMWAAVLKANFVSLREGFQGREALHDFFSFVAAEPRIERKLGRYYVTTSDGRSPFGSAKTREEAQAKRNAIPELAQVPADGSTIEARGETFVVLTTDRRRALDEAPTQEVALDRITAAHAARSASAAAVRSRIFVFLLGFLLGTAGAAAVWRETRRTPSSVAQRGIARTFQNIRLFQGMTVVENVLVGMHRHLFSAIPVRRRWRDAVPFVITFGLFAAFWGTLRFSREADTVPGAAGPLLGLFLLAVLAWLVLLTKSGVFSPTARAVERQGRADALELLRFVGLEARAGDLASNLPYGDQRRLEIARALATRPALLLLDEPAAGMNPNETVSLMKLIQAIRERGVTVLLIEHHMRVVMGISDRIAVLVYGQKIAEGTPEEIRQNPKVIEAYLGQEELG